MNIIEALKEVRNGKLVSRKSWFHNITLSISSKSDEIVAYNISTTAEIEYKFTENDVQADDWVIKHFRRSLTFVEAFKEIKNGKEVKRDFWNDGCYVDKNSILDSLVEADLVANDWEVIYK